MSSYPELFPNQPADAYIWIYSADRSVTAAESNHILLSVQDFLSTWTSHDQPVVAEAATVEERFLVIAAHIPGGDISGCGIDKLDRAVTGAGIDVGVQWLDGLAVLYRSNPGIISAVSRSDFARLAAKATVGAETIVFDTSVHSLSELRSHGLERPVAESWHGSVFQIESTVGA